MASKFGGVPVAQATGGSRFGGIPVDAGGTIHDDVPVDVFGDGETGATSVRQARTVPQELLRSAGLGGRAVLEGIGGTLGIVTDPLTAGVDYLRNKIAPPQQTTAGLISGQQPAPVRTAGAQEAFGKIADVIGLPSPETATERVAGGITRAVSGGGGVIGLGRWLATQAPGVASRVGTLFASQPGTQIAGAATGAGASEITREAGGGQGAQLAAGLIGGLSPAAIKTSVSAATRGAVRGADPALMQRNTADFRMLGTEPSVGQASGSRIVQGVENLLAGGPTSAGVMGRAAERQADDIGSGLQRLADDFMPNASAERAGRAIEKGVETFARNTSATKRALYWQADRLIPEDSPVRLENTWQTVSKLTTPTAGATATTGALINPRIAKLRETLTQDIAAGGGRIPYTALKRIRTDIGEQISDYSFSPDTPTRELKQLYASLSRDMETAARAHGPDALNAAKRANNYTRAVAERMEQVQRVIDKNGGPEKVYNAVLSGTQDGGTTLRAVMQSLPKEGQQAITGAVIKRMGLATPGQQGAAGDVFSSQTFLTNWNKVSPEAKRALFDRHGPKFVANMDRIARVASNIKEGSKVFANPSGTANRLAAGTYLLSLAGSLATGQVGTAGALAAGGGVANALARGLTNPRFVSWLAQATEKPVSTVPQQILLLKGIADREKDDDLAELAEHLENQANNQSNGAGN